MRRDTARRSGSSEELGAVEPAAGSRTAVRTAAHALDDDIGDDLLRLVFTACHPVLSTEARVALTLRLLGGLTTDEIARAFLMPEATVAQRIVRAKRTLADARRAVRGAARRRAGRAARLGAGGDLPRLQRGLFGDGGRGLDAAGAVRGGAAARPRPRRTGAARAGGARPGRADGDPGVALRGAHRAEGAPILLLDQNRARWDRLLIRRGLAALARAEALGGARGPYALQAAIAACHARARPADATDWRADRRRSTSALAERVRRRRWSSSTARWRSRWRTGRRRGWRSWTSCNSEPALKNYHLLPSVRGIFLKKLGRLDEGARRSSTARRR